MVCLGNKQIILWPQDWKRSVLIPIPKKGNAKEAEAEWFCEDLQDLLALTPKNDVLFITETGIQESPQGTGMQTHNIPGITGKFGLRVWNEAGQRLAEFCQENTLVIANTLFQQHKRQLYT